MLRVPSGSAVRGRRAHECRTDGSSPGAGRRSAPTGGCRTWRAASGGTGGRLRCRRSGRMPRRHPRSAWPVGRTASTSRAVHDSAISPIVGTSISSRSLVISSSSTSVSSVTRNPRLRTTSTIPWAASSDIASRTGVADTPSCTCQCRGRVQPARLHLSGDEGGAEHLGDAVAVAAVGPDARQREAVDVFFDLVGHRAANKDGPAAARQRSSSPSSTIVASISSQSSGALEVSTSHPSAGDEHGVLAADVLALLGDPDHRIDRHDDADLQRPRAVVADVMDGHPDGMRQVAVELERTSRGGLVVRVLPGRPLDDGLPSPRAPPPSAATSRRRERSERGADGGTRR